MAKCLGINHCWILWEGIQEKKMVRDFILKWVDWLLFQDVAKWQRLWRNSFRAKTILSCLGITCHQSVRYLGTRRLLHVFSWAYTVSEAWQGQYDCFSSQKLKYQDLLNDISWQHLGIGLVEGLNLSAIFSESKPPTLLSTTLEDPYSH